MIRRLLAATLITVGMLAVAVGAQRWFDAHAAESVVHSLMRAINAGDRQAVLGLLVPEHRQVVEVRSQQEQYPPWQRQTGVKYHIQQVKIDGERAVAELSITKNGFVIHPIVYLRRGETTRWKIERIDNLQVDPRWDRLQRTRERQQGEQLAKQIRAALANRPGVTVDRVKISDLPGRPPE